MKANKYHIRPTPEQEGKLAAQFGCARFVYNDALAKKIQFWKSGAYNISRFELQSMLVWMKQDFDTKWLKHAHSQVLQSSLLHLDNAFKNFFEGRAGFPKFKKKHGKQSCQYPQGVKIKDNMIYLPKVGWVKAVIHREAIGKIKTVTVSRDAVGKYYVSVLLDDDSKKPDRVHHVSTHLGVDAGITKFITDSTGATVDNPRFYQCQLPNLCRKQKKLSRKQKGSHNRAKAKLLVAKAHKKVANARNDFQHKISRQIADENQAVFVEDLKIRNLSRNKRIAKQILDIGWYGFTEKLKYKLEDRGGHLVKVPAAYTSQTCFCCGHVTKDNRKTQERFECVKCGHTLNADHNAALNIQQRGVLKLKADGHTVSACGGLGESLQFVKFLPMKHEAPPVNVQTA